jgi:hypothetical protein
LARCIKELTVHIEQAVRHIGQVAQHIGLATFEQSPRNILAVPHTEQEFEALVASQLAFAALAAS